MKTAKLLFRGAGLQVLTMVISIASSFFLAPFVIHSLGDRWYGLWILVGSFVGFYGLLDLGISSATQRYLADAMPRNDPDELNTIVAASLTMFMGITLIALLVTAGIVAFAPLLMGNPQDAFTFRVVTFVMGAGIAISFPFYALFGILTANLRLDYSSYIQLGKIIVRTTLFFLVLSWGYGIVVLALTSVSVDLAGYIPLVIMARSLAPWMKLKKPHFAYSKMRELISFGIYSFVGQIASMIKFKLDNIVIASSVGLGSVTHFNIATKLNGYYMNVLGRLVPSPTSIYARYHGRGELHQIRDKFLILSRIRTILGVLGMGAVLIFARPFITLWVGPAYLDAFIPLVIIMAGRLGRVVFQPGVGVIYALARQKTIAFVNLGEAVANLGLSLLLVRWYGIVGVALGTAIPMLAVRLAFTPFYLCHIMELPMSRFLKNLLPVMFTAGIVQLPLVYAMTKVDVHTYWQIVVWVIGYYSPLIIFFYAVMLSSEERQLFKEALPDFPKKFKASRTGPAK